MLEIHYYHFGRNYFMKIKTLVAVLLSTFAISTSYAADEAMPATSNAAESASTAMPAKDNAMDSAKEETKKQKKHKKHKNHKKHHHEKSEKMADATPAATNNMAPAATDNMAPSK